MSEKPNDTLRKAMRFVAGEPMQAAPSPADLLARIDKVAAVEPSREPLDIAWEIGFHDGQADLADERRALVEALAQIVKAEGQFSRDPLKHAHFVIEDMRAVAAAALKGAGVEVTT